MKVMQFHIGRMGYAFPVTSLIPALADVFGAESDMLARFLYEPLCGSRLDCALDEIKSMVGVSNNLLDDARIA